MRANSEIFRVSQFFSQQRQPYWLGQHSDVRALVGLAIQVTRILTIRNRCKSFRSLMTTRVYTSFSATGPMKHRQLDEDKRLIMDSVKSRVVDCQGSKAITLTAAILVIDWRTSDILGNLIRYEFSQSGLNLALYINATVRQSDGSIREAYCTLSSVPDNQLVFIDNERIIFIPLVLHRGGMSLSITPRICYLIREENNMFVLYCISVSEIPMNDAEYHVSFEAILVKGYFHLPSDDESILIVSPGNATTMEKKRFFPDEDNLLNIKHQNSRTLDNRQRDKKIQADRSTKPEETKTPKQHNCGVCGKSFSWPCILRRHAVVHTNSENYRCDFCDKLSKLHASLEGHKLVVHVGEESNGGTRKHTCEVCGKRAACRRDLAIHMIKCNNCSRVCTGQSTKELHTSIGERKKAINKPTRNADKCQELVECPAIAGLGFDERKLLSIQTIAEVNQSVLYEAYRTISFAPDNQKFARMPFLCGALMVVFYLVRGTESENSLGSLNQLLNIYTPVDEHNNLLNVKNKNPNELEIRQRDEVTQDIQPAKPDETKTPTQHKCDACDKSFKWPSLLQRHVIVHTTSRNYQCGSCKKSFKYPFTLVSHRLVAHASDEPKGGRRAYACEVCGKLSPFRRDLEVHMLVHSKNRPFACDLCDWSFSTSSNLYRHRRALHPQATQDA
ncbi:hypothetical protein CSKR_107851 [Clonorchis sinensis]|uniref:C2H2-type domain-containing protein n=1 Tax=Clonorchis sinensis TaxID=79923 RepID=A0A419PIP3_CLOSI|nr:hypothetical protein CSKR_107851 [Clonorchis sinensis]